MAEQFSEIENFKQSQCRIKQDGWTRLINMYLKKREYFIVWHSKQHFFKVALGHLKYRLQPNNKVPFFLDLIYEI